MKKICLVAGLLSFSAISFAQQNVQVSDTSSKAVVTSEEKIMKLEKEVADLKASQLEMQKRLSEVQPVTTNGSKKKKLFVSRAGSKQLVWAEKEQLFY